MQKMFSLVSISLSSSSIPPYSHTLISPPPVSQTLFSFPLPLRSSPSSSEPHLSFQKTERVRPEKGSGHLLGGAVAFLSSLPPLLQGALVGLSRQCRSQTADKWEMMDRQGIFSGHPMPRRHPATLPLEVVARMASSVTGLEDTPIPHNMKPWGVSVGKIMDQWFDSKQGSFLYSNHIFKYDKRKIISNSYKDTQSRNKANSVWMLIVTWQLNQIWIQIEKLVWRRLLLF